MSFVKESVNRTPIVDNVFAIVNMAKKAKQELGNDVVDATIGSLYTEENQLAALDTVFDSLKHLDNKVLAAYASSFAGNPDFNAHVLDWVLKDHSHLYKDVVATPGGTGAVGMTVSECLEPGQTLIIPEIAWGSYALMAQMNNLKTASYSLFKDGKFNLDSFREVCGKVLEEQNKLCVIINDPCHNPTGYSMTRQEWEEVVAFLNECSEKAPVVLLNDIAYIDFAYRGDAAKEYFSVFDNISDNVVVVIAFSLSKSMTSYGMRCGAAIILGKTEEAVREMKIVFEKDARATWSNVNNGAMAMFVDVLDNHLEDYLEEKQTYVDLLRERSQIFLKEAEEAGLSHYPYREGFFVTLDLDNETRDRFHEALLKENIYTVKVNKGIRVALCSMPLEKVRGLAPRMKAILDSVQA